MSTAVTTTDLRTRLGQARDAEIAARKALERARGHYADANSQAARMREQPRAEAAAEDLRSAERGVAHLEGQQAAALGQLADGADLNGPRAADFAYDSGVAGSWLSTAIRASGEGGGAMAAGPPMTTGELGSMDALDQIFFKRLEQHSALLRAGITTADIVTSEVKVGVVTGDLAPSEPVGETQPIPTTAVPMEDVVIAPPKFPVLVSLSVESLDDARPIRLAAIETKMMQSVGVGFDAAGFHGAAKSLHPGLANTPGIGVVKAEGETPLAYDWNASAIGALLAVSAEPERLRLFIHPATAEALLKLKTTVGDYLLDDLQTVMTSLMGVPTTVTRGCAEGEAFAVDVGTLVIIRRQEVLLEVFREYDFSHAVAAIRAIARLQLVAADPRGTVRITGLPVKAKS